MTIRLTRPPKQSASETQWEQWMELLWRYLQQVQSSISASDDSVDSLPVGTLIAHWDNGGAFTFDTDIWTYSDGSVLTIGGSEVTIPDMSNRYCVGFGTEGAGDIGTDTWSTTAVGNASHSVDFTHDHDQNVGIAVENWLFEHYVVSTGSSGTDMGGLNGAGALDGYRMQSGVQNALSTASIQPRSVKVRWLFKKA